MGHTGAMDLVDACRSPIRREIMATAETLHAEGTTITAKGLAVKLQRPLTNVSYHVVELLKVGALEETGGEQKRGAWQRHFAPTEGFRASMTDTVALDRIAEFIDGYPQYKGIAKIIRDTGRPVEA